MESKNKFLKILNVVFLALVLFLLGYMAFMYHTSESTVYFDDKSVYDWSDEWLVSYEGKENIEVDIPTRLECGRGKTIILRKTLPTRIKKYNCIMVEGIRQDIIVSIGGIQRTGYTDRFMKPGRNSSPSVIVLVPVYSSDASEDVTIQLTSYTENSGALERIYLCNEKSIVISILKSNAVWLFLIAAIIVLGIACIVIHVLYARSSSIGNALLYLFIYTILSAFWCFSQLGARQLFVESIGFVERAGYYCFMLMPVSVLLYGNCVTGGRYKGFIRTANILLFLSFLGQNFVNLAFSYGFYEMEIYSNIVGLAAGLLGLWVCISEALKGYRKSTPFMLPALIMLIVFIAMGHMDCWSMYRGGRSGCYTIGCLVFLLLNVIYSFRVVRFEQRKKQDAENASIAKSQFLATMSHEIRTPINTVLGMNEMILRDSKEDLVREYANNISAAGKTLLSLINDILDFSKIESGKMEIIEVEYTMKSLLRDLALMTENRIAEKGLKLVLDIDETIPAGYYGDEVRLKQVITNLLTNAAKYTKAGSITFIVKNNGRDGDDIRLWFSVKDTGIGIREEDISRLMDSFVRFDEKKNRNIEGTGLGLSITKQLLGLMGSQLEIKSKYGEGSEFSFEITQKVIDESPMGYIMSKEKVVERKNGITFSAPEAMVLAVDDTPMNLIVVKGLLKPSGIRVDTCESGSECLELCKNNYYDIILMDHMMPGLDGIETLKQLRQDYNSPCCGSKVIALTANAISGAAEMYRENGFDDYLTKPIEIGELDGCLKRFLPKELVKPLAVTEEAAAEATDERSEKSTVEIKADENSGETLGIGTQDGPLSNSLIDGSVAMGFCGDDMDCYREILLSYYKQGSKNLQKAPADSGKLFGEGVSIEDFTIQVHALKSGSKTVGAMELSNRALELETAGHEGNEEFIAAHEPECRKIYEETIASIGEYLLERGLIEEKKARTAQTEPGAETVSLDALNLSDKIENLDKAIEALEEFEYDEALELLQELRAELNA